MNLIEKYLIAKAQLEIVEEDIKKYMNKNHIVAFKDPKGNRADLIDDNLIVKSTYE